MQPTGCQNVARGAGLEIGKDWPAVPLAAKTGRKVLQEASWFKLIWNCFLYSCLLLKNIHIKVFKSIVFLKTLHMLYEETAHAHTLETSFIYSNLILFFFSVDNNHRFIVLRVQLNTSDQTFLLKN